MSNDFVWKSMLVSPAVLGVALLGSGTAIASSTTTEAPHSSSELAQFTPVSQFSDVQTTDWAFQALQSLVERYGCVSGYPNGTFRGKRALSRYEFAAALNSCLGRVNELIATATADLVTKQDLVTIQRLQEEFSAELATLRSRVDTVEKRTAQLETNQFSTTTKLKGEAIFVLTDSSGNDSAPGETVLQNRVRLNLQSSFTGKDVLDTRLTAGNAQGFGDTGETKQTFEIGKTNPANNVELDQLTYQTPLGRARIYLAATGGEHSDYVRVNNPYFSDKNDGGALSTFTAENPIYRIGGGSGVAVNIPLGAGGSVVKSSSLSIGYLASGNRTSGAENPASGGGLFDGNYAALGQLNFNLSNRLALAATYVHGYHGVGSTLFDSGRDNGAVVGTPQANSLGRSALTGSQISASSSNSYGLSAAFHPTNKLAITGFISYHDITGFGVDDDYEAWSYGMGVALPDLGKKGNVLGIFGGAQPYSFNNHGGVGNRNIPYQIEGFYRYQVSDHISVTPGLVWVPAIGQNDNQPDTFIGTLRTKFSF
ncbi:iron uptake porin [Cylindrospermopsis raciborskii]|uniref:iron uptake porin n=1 Tax=Cylindrospermopsis raciborskii TaxID=77022 RepID=UPI00077894F5|nr:iron uptake porin [Cylindrospermopsis raciborskii]MCZ2201097.1 iron uptake porin [Cylindrospermopsis raciborskii PAMP2012]MCZ2204786.1 iron uptake porin [Cylindrospermopsis raciborskii PAMP2011]